MTILLLQLLCYHGCLCPAPKMPYQFIGKGFFTVPGKRTAPVDFPVMAYNNIGIYMAILSFFNQLDA